MHGFLLEPNAEAIRMLAHEVLRSSVMKTPVKSDSTHHFIKLFPMGNFIQATQINACVSPLTAWRQ